MTLSTIEPEDRFESEEALRDLLDKWQAPGPSESLDKRVSSSFRRAIDRAGVVKDSIDLPRIDKEVLAMKFCSTCQEEFADKFSFCPVDGTPLSTASVSSQREESAPASSNQGIVTDATPEALSGAAMAYSIAAGREGFNRESRETTREAIDRESMPPAPIEGSHDHVNKGEYHLTIMDDAGLASRLSHELGDVAHE